jgi:hypothetical protein
VGLARDQRLAVIQALRDAKPKERKQLLDQLLAAAHGR